MVTTFAGKTVYNECISTSSFSLEKIFSKKLYWVHTSFVIKNAIIKFHDHLTSTFSVEVHVEVHVKLHCHMETLWENGLHVLNTQYIKSTVQYQWNFLFLLWYITIFQVFQANILNYKGKTWANVQFKYLHLVHLCIIDFLFPQTKSFIIN